MKLKINEIKALVYSDLFDYPLTRPEMKLWSLSYDCHGLVTDLHGYRNLIQSKQGYYFLKGRENLVQLRKQREEISKKKLIKLTKLIKLIQWIPTIEGIFLTGSVAAGNAKCEADLDLMIITSANCLWLTRLVVVAILKIQGKYRGGSGEWGDKVCTNIFLDRNHLKIKEANLYSAHEVLLAKCVFDRGGIQKKWILENRWVAEYFPNAHILSLRATVKSATIWSEIASSLLLLAMTIILTPVELIAFLCSHFYMMRKITNEQIGWGYAFFHPRNLSIEITKKFERKIKKLKLVI